MKKPIILTCILLVIVSCIHAQQTEFPKLTGPYLGQKPPGNIPVIFAPGLISSESHSECCRAISHDGKEIFFIRMFENGDMMLRTAEGKNGWTKPAPNTYTNKPYQYTPFISPKGDIMLFMDGESRPTQESKDSPQELWMLSRVNNSWSEKRCLGTTLGGIHPYYISIAGNGSVYFSCMDRSGIYRSIWKDGKYLQAEKLEDEENGFEKSTHPYIAPDESYIIVHSKGIANKTDYDLYISFRLKDGTWTKLTNLGSPINTEANEVCPSASSDGKYLFFGRWKKGGQNDLYWVSAKIIEELRLEE